MNFVMLLKAYIYRVGFPGYLSNLILLSCSFTLDLNREFLFWSVLSSSPGESIWSTQSSEGNIKRCCKTPHFYWLL